MKEFMPDLEQEMYTAIKDNKPNDLLNILKNNPEAANKSAESSGSILHTAIFFYEYAMF